MGRLQLALLGTPQVRHCERTLTFPTRKALALLMYLVTKENLHSREKLTALLWPQSDEEHGRMTLRRTLALLRQALAEGGKLQGPRTGRVEEALVLAEQAVNIAQAIGGLFAQGLAHRMWSQALTALHPPRGISPRNILPPVCRLCKPVKPCQMWRGHS